VRRAPRSRRSGPAQLIAELALIAAMSALPFAHEIWAADLLLLPVLFVLPGMLLLRALRMPADRVRAFPVYVPCASIVVLLAAGALANFVGPALGAAQPLRTVPMVVALSSLCVPLALLGATAGRDSGLPWRLPRLRPHRAWPLILPAVSAIGALQFNNGHGRILAIAGMAAAVATIVICTICANRMSPTQLALAIFGVALAAGWSFSLRSHFLYGWDIASEYRVAKTTFAAGIWHSNHPKDAYGAMLSLTTFPALLQALVGASPLLIFKAIYPVLFALFPVGLFGLANRLVGRRYAFMAAAFLVVQGFFFQQMSGLARQEIGLLVFIGLVAAVLESGVPRRTQWPLVACFAIALVVSHYSTTYLAIDMFAGYCVFQFLVLVVRRRRVGTGAVLVALVALAAGAYLWYFPVTDSNSNATSFVSDLNKNGFDFLPSAKPGQNPLQAYLTGNIPSRIEANEYERMVSNLYRSTVPYVRPLPSAGDPRYALHDATVPADAVRAPPVAVHGLDLEQTLLSQLVDVLAVIAALGLVFRRRSSPLARNIGLLGLSTLAVLVLMRVSGTVATDYTPERAIVQLMVPLVIGVAWLLECSVERWRGLRIVLPLAAALALAAVLFTSSGLRAVTLGGPGTTNLASRGEDYERFYVSQPELAAAEWLDRTVPIQDVVTADRYGQLRIYGTSPRAKAVLTDATPMTLDHDAWIYADRANTLNGRARARTGERYALYNWPRRFLADHYNRVYTDGSSQVYHGQ
jgi:uncharacterized membrane protein